MANSNKGCALACVCPYMCSEYVVWSGRSAWNERQGRQTATTGVPCEVEVQYVHPDTTLSMVQ